MYCAKCKRVRPEGQTYQVFFGKVTKRTTVPTKRVGNSQYYRTITEYATVPAEGFLCTECMPKIMASRMKGTEVTRAMFCVIFSLPFDVISLGTFFAPNFPLGVAIVGWAGTLMLLALAGRFIFRFIRLAKRRSWDYQSAFPPATDQNLRETEGAELALIGCLSTEYRRRGYPMGFTRLAATQ